MLTFLIIVLIIAVLFGRQIKDLIAYGIFLVLALWLWDLAWWGKLLGGFIIFAILYNILEDTIRPVVEYFQKRNQKKDTDSQDA